MTALLAAGTLTALSADTGAGSLLVESDPAGAAVYVDGRLAGETPLALAGVVAGLHRVRLERLGFLENSRVVTVKPGEQSALRARLTDPAPQATQGAALRIVVVEGEGAVNIIQQKTAVAPVIEVRDRNDQPVSGVLVRFAIDKGKASFNGARTLSVTTDAAGRATAAGLSPTGSGALRIAASAAFQGQTAAATIAQTTVATAAEAASVTAGGTVASGGGLSHTALAGIIGGAGAGVAGVAIASRRSDGSGGNNSPQPQGSTVTSKTFTGPFNGQLVITTNTTSQSGTSTCASTLAIAGTMTIQLDQRPDGTVTGMGSTDGTQTETAFTQSPTCGPQFGTIPFRFGGSISGVTSNIAFSQQTQASGGGTGSSQGTVTNNVGFNGSLSNGVITGTVTYSTTGTATGPGSSISQGGSTTFPVTLR